MTQYTAPIRRVDTAKGHHYKDANGLRVPGTTTILKALPKDALVNWAGNATAEAAVNRWDEFAAMPPAQRLKALQKARYDDRDTAADRGTEVHHAAEALIAHGRLDDVPNDIHGHAEACARFLDDFDFTPEHVEYSIASYQHGYAGTGDWIATIRIPASARVPASWRDYLDEKIRVLGDWKTNRSGIFAETRLQDAAYRYADTLITGDAEQPMPAVDACAAVHLRSDGSYGFVPLLVTPALHRVFLYLQQIYLWHKDADEGVGAPIHLPASSTLRLVRETP